ncbi:hypothetical protein B0H14DRAFT_2586054 [Mycena olivaceomarginata]|nr:hypothetical protein B0H14DRAFT_2586054 [Mycena olivaceomarginata]
MVVLSSCHHPLVSRLPVFTSLFVNGTPLHHRACQFTDFPPRMPPLDRHGAKNPSAQVNDSGTEVWCTITIPHPLQSILLTQWRSRPVVWHPYVHSRHHPAARWGGEWQAHVHGSYTPARSRGGRAVTCKNVECHKFDAKNTIHKCGGCSTTLYCSKECQTLAWKQVFFRHLSIRDTWHHLLLLRRLACLTYPVLHSCELLIRIDYTAVPPAYSVVPLAETERRKERRAHPRPPLKGPRQQCGQHRVHTRDRPCGLW